MTRHFLRVGGRWVHYRRLGQGPAVLLLHGSPQSSRAVEALAATLAALGFCAIAPDTPGNGLSTPLPGQPSTLDYAEAVAAFADGLGLQRLALYGFHTGAATACVFAARYPERSAAVVLNGLCCWTEAERTDLLTHYLPPFVPQWDGGHMTWAWARVEEQTVFFPWHRPSVAARMVYDVPSVAATHLNAMDLLAGGDGYRAPYAAAFGFRVEDWIRRLSCPALLAATRLDPLRPHLERPPLAGRDSTVFEDAAALADAASRHLLAHPGDPAPAAPDSGHDAAFLSRGWRDGLSWSGRLAGAGRPLVLLHDAGGSQQQFAGLLAALPAPRPVLAFDLPGHGGSAVAAAAAPLTLDSVADQVAASWRGLGLDQPVLAGIGAGADVAALLGRRGQAVLAGALGRPPQDHAAPLAEAAPSLAPSWDGGHLLRAFRIARWRQLFDPWFSRDHAHARPQGRLDPSWLQGQALDLLLAGDHWAALLGAARTAPTAPPPRLSDSDDPLDWLPVLSAYAR